MLKEPNGQKRPVNLVKALEEIEDFFLHEKEGKLYKFLLNIVEKPLIENVLYKTGGNQLKTAKILGINRNTLHTKIKRLNIYVGDFKCPRELRDKKGGVISRRKY